jgi:hypothetical protein
MGGPRVLKNVGSKSTEMFPSHAYRTHDASKPGELRSILLTKDATKVRFKPGSARFRDFEPCPNLEPNLWSGSTHPPEPWTGLRHPSPYSSCSPEGEDEEENATIFGIKSTLIVSVITVMNEGDGIGTYILAIIFTSAESRDSEMIYV